MPRLWPRHGAREHSLTDDSDFRSPKSDYDHAIDKGTVQTPNRSETVHTLLLNNYACG